MLASLPSKRGTRAADMRHTCLPAGARFAQRWRKLGRALLECSCNGPIVSKLAERVTVGGKDPGLGVRGAIDALVLGALVDLFQAYGVAVAPLPRIAMGRVPVLPEVSATIAFSRAGAAPGRLSLSVPPAVLDLSRSGATATSQQDWIRELTNQQMGRVKNRLLHFSVRVEVGLLVSVDSKQLALQLERTPNARVYAGRTLRGEIIVTLDGMPEESELSYVGAGTQPSEGDVILF